MAWMYNLSCMYVCMCTCYVLVQRNLLLKLQGAYNDHQVISVSENSSFMQTLRYYINKNLETEIELQTVRNVLRHQANVYKTLE